jgi:hypothetical protein
LIIDLSTVGEPAICFGLGIEALWRMRMSLARILTLTSLLLFLKAANAQSPPGAIRGTLKERGSAIIEASVFLQSFDDEKCAKLFESHKGNARSVERLNACMHDMSTTTPDDHGNYSFAGLQPGWYAIHFLWSIREKPSHAPSAFRQGSWGVMYAGHTDSTGKYDTMAQDKPFHVSSTEELTRDFDTR